MFEGSVLLFEAITFITTGTIIFKFIMNIGFLPAGTQKFILYTLTEKNKLTNKQANKQTNKQSNNYQPTQQRNKQDIKQTQIRFVKFLVDATVANLIRFQRLFV